MLGGVNVAKVIASRPSCQEIGGEKRCYQRTFDAVEEWLLLGRSDCVELTEGETEQAIIV